MGQLTIYLPEDIERQVRRHARRARKSVSAYIASLERKEHRRSRDKNGHPSDMRALFGSVPDLQVPEDLPPEIPALGASISRRHRRVRRVSQRR
jgi:hypothetical protein